MNSLCNYLKSQHKCPFEDNKIRVASLSVFLYVPEMHGLTRALCIKQFIKCAS